MQNIEKRHFLRDYAPPPFVVETARLELDLGADETRVRSSLQVRRRVPDARELQLDAAPEMEIRRVSRDGAEIPFTHRDGILRVEAPGDAFVLDVENVIRPRENTQLEGLYASGPVLCTQCEPEGFRRIAPFVDRPDNLARFSVTLSAEKSAYPQLLSNGHLVESRDLSGGRHMARWEDPFPKPSYLFAVVAGDLVCRQAEYRTRSGRTVTCRVWVEPHNADRAGHALFSLLQAMAWDERAFGRECDLDLYQIVAVDAFNAGAMENKGLNIFNSRYVLASPETATDADYDDILRVVGHEYFHNWSGNRVTLRDWFQLSLKEGLTVFRDQEFVRDTLSAGVKRVEDARIIRTLQFLEDAGPLSHPVRPESYADINNFYTRTVYEKGAEVVRMLQTWVGRDAFRAGMDLYFARHDHQAVTVEDFLACLAEASGRDLSAFLEWYRQKGTPEVTARCDIANGRARIALSQENPKAGPDAPALPIPMVVSFVGPDGQPVPLRTAEGEEVREIRIPFESRSLEVEIEGVPEGATVCWLGDFSAPVRVRAPQDTERDVLRRALGAPDAYNRWSAMDGLARGAVREILDGAEERKACARIFEAVRGVLDAHEDEAAPDPAFGALLLQLPSEKSLCEDFGPVHAPEAVCAARDALARALAGEFAPRLEARFESLQKRLPEHWGPHSAWRTYKNQLFSLWGWGEDARIREAAWRLYEGAANMTDRQAALSVLCRTRSPERDRALSDFHARFGHDVNMRATWFSMQAASPAPDTLERVRKLQGHPDFDWNNPNLVRSLLRTFAGNVRHFHRADGTGHDVLVGAVRRLSGINAHVAAALVREFSQMRVLPGERATRLLEKLRRLQDDPALGAQVREPLAAIVQEEESRQGG